MKKFLIFSLVVSMQLAAQIKVACIGDSITYGAKIENRQQLAYPRQLGLMLGEKYSVQNFGVSARTLLKKGNAPYWKTKEYKNALKWQPNIVIIKLGTNDTKMVNWKHKDELKQDLIDLVDSFQKLKSKPTVYLCLPVPAFLDGKSIDRTRLKDGVIPVIKAVAALKKLPIIDLYQRMLDKEALMPDKIHPNAEGAYELASEVYHTLTKKAFKKPYQAFKKQCMEQTQNWNGFKLRTFELNGAACKIVEPKKAAPGKPWIWRARFWGHEPQTDLALLNAGFHVAYCDIANLFGAPKAVERWNKFYKYTTEKLGFSKKVVLEGMSRGGLIIFNWANANPEKVSCIYGDAPVCDFKSWPAGKGSGKPRGKEWKSCQKVYNFKNETQALAWKGNPIDHTATLAKANIPIMIVYGKADGVVPPSENCLLFAKRFKAAGGKITLIGKDKCGHHPHSLKDPKEIVNFVLSNSKAK